MWLENHMNIRELMGAICNQCISIKNTSHLEVGLPKRTWRNLRKPYLLVIEEIGEYLSNRVEGHRQIWHGDNRCYRPFLVGRRRRSIDDLVSRWAPLHVDGLVSGGVEGGGGAGRGGAGGEGGGDPDAGGWATQPGHRRRM